jgi:hypothetical protein
MIIWSSGVGKPVVNLRTVLWTVSLTAYFTFGWWAPTPQRRTSHWEDLSDPKNTHQVSAWNELDPTDKDRGHYEAFQLTFLSVLIAMGYEGYYQHKKGSL